jgi:hypothetical protein
MIPSEVVIVAKPKSKGIKTAQVKPKVAINVINLGNNTTPVCINPGNY